MRRLTWKVWGCLSLGLLSWLGTPATVHAACETPDLLIVLDRSCSMGDSISGTRKWNIAVNAIKTITNSYKGKLRFGLELFNSSATIAYKIGYGSGSCVGDGVATNCVPNLQSRLGSYTGGTNLVTAITTAQSHLTAVRNGDSVKGRKRSVMFLTDGQAGCANSQVQTMFNSLGVKTFVIGFGSGVSASCLNSMATAGQTALSGTNKFYRADNSTSLNNAMKAIADAASAEVCNNADDDCDGLIDEGLTKGCSGPCGQGTQVCKAGVWGACSTAQQPQPEKCNNKDDDCDGTTDEGLTRNCSTACGSGVETCRAGSWVNCSAPPVVKETCNNKDDDCDGQIDNALKRPCKTICESGEETCNAGNWEKCSARKPIAEECNDKDDDCDGQTDEDLKRPCQTACGPGEETCNAGKWENCTGPLPEKEVCDGKDNDCDGQVDESLKRDCSSDCGVGKETCRAGQWVDCDALKPQKEICNGRDDDCNGKIDEMPPTPDCQKCINGLCYRTCTSECTKGFRCEEGVCKVDPCEVLKCGNNEQCQSGQCVDVCANVTCKDNEHCVKGKCEPKPVNANCSTVGCPGGKVCQENKCVDDPCAGVRCKEREFCRAGKCVGSCADIVCGDGARCEDGDCIKDACVGKACSDGKLCHNGDCIEPAKHPCAGVSCAEGQYCKEGLCVGDPCDHITCPHGHECHRGQCYGGVNPKPKPEPIPGPDGAISNPDGQSNPDGGTVDNGATNADQGPANDVGAQEITTTHDCCVDVFGDTGPDSGGLRRSPGGCVCNISNAPSHHGILSLFLLVLLGLCTIPRKQ